MKKALLSLIFALVLSGCATQIPPEVIANADYGPPPPKNYQALVKSAFSHILIDPTSPIYEFNSPRKGYITHGTGDFYAGWLVCGEVNSKNRMGGYNGQLPFYALIYKNKVVAREIGEVPDNQYGISSLNDAILAICNR